MDEPLSYQDKADGELATKKEIREMRVHGTPLDWTVNIFDRVVERMTEEDSNWNFLIGLKKKHMGRRGNNLFTHIYTVHKRIVHGGESDVILDNEQNSPEKQLNDSPMSFGGRRTRSKSADLATARRE